MLDDRAAHRAGTRGRVAPVSVADVAPQLDELEEQASKICTRTRDTDDEAELDVLSDPFLQRMPRDGALL